MLRINRSICPRVSCEGAHIEANVTSDERVLAVRDRGPGIPAAHLPPVTARVDRVDRSRGTAGNGCGLSIVTAIAKLHDGRLELSDAAAGAARTLVLLRRQAPI
jgi:K+-sensing histidine kinase KdpD